MKDLKHPNVVRVVDFFQDKTRNTIYMVMELLQGESLESFVEKNKPMQQSDI